MKLFWIPTSMASSFFGGLWLLIYEFSPSFVYVERDGVGTPMCLRARVFEY